MKRFATQIAIPLSLISFLFAGDAHGQTCNTVSTTTTCSPANGTLTIPATGSAGANQYPSTITFSNPGNIASVYITLNQFSSSAAGNMGFVLEGPAGQRLVVLDGVCNGINPVSGANITLRDGFSGPPGGSASCSAVTGAVTYSPYACCTDSVYPAPLNGLANAQRPVPHGTSTFANTFTGSAVGQWKLYAANVVGGTSAPATLGNASTPPWTLVVTQNAIPSTSTSISSNLNPSLTTQSVTLTANVSSTSTVNGGVVTFRDNNVAISCSGGSQTVVNGIATCSTTFSSEGAHPLTAAYGGNGSFGASSSSSLTQVVNRATDVSGLQFCNAGSIAFPAPGTSGNNLGTPGTPYPSIVTVSGVAGTIQNVTLTLRNYRSSRPQSTGLMLVGPNGQALDLFSSAGGISPITARTFTLDDVAGTGFVPSPPAANGVYLSTSTSTSIAPAYCTSASCPPGAVVSQFAPTTYVSAPNVGSGSLLQQFAGSGANGTWKLFAVERFAGESGAIDNGWCLNFTMAVNAHPTTTSVSSSVNPSLVGGNVTFTATVTNSDSPGTPVNEGSVTFSENGSPLQTSAVSNGQATFLTNALTEGTHTITATYTGTANFGVSSGTRTQTVNRDTTVPTVNGNVYTYCNAGGITVPAGGVNSPLAGPSNPYPSNMLVAGLPGTINKVTVGLNAFSNARPDWGTMLLVGPCQTANCSPTVANGIDFFSRVGGVNSVSNLNLVFDDAAGSSVGASLSSGTFRPTSAGGPNTYPAPAPAGPYLYASPFGSTTLAMFNNTSGAGVWSLYSKTIQNGGVGTIGSWCLNITVNRPNISIAKSHTGNFRQGDTGKTYSIVVANAGPGPTAGQVTVTDALDTKLTPTAASGTGWNCHQPQAGQTVTCDRSDALASGQSYPAITVTVNVAADAPASITNTATVAGGGDNTAGNNTSNDPTTIDPKPASVAVNSGNSQSAQVGTTFSALQAIVRDAGNNPMSGVTVTFTAPGAGASGTFANGTNVTTAITDASGIATASTFTANTSVGGPYTVAASVGGVVTAANFSLTNTAGPAATISATAGTPQSATVNLAFLTALQATVRDAGNNPVPGVTVTFTAPGSGASGTFAGTGTNVATAPTNSSGVATAPAFTANGTAGGPYNVVATSGAATSANFALTNTAGAPGVITASGGSPQSTGIGTAFATALQATVTDGSGNPVNGVVVTFTAPNSGASGTFAGTGTNVATAPTNASGIATAPALTANATAGGPYNVVASSGAATSANFALTNTAGAAAMVAATAGTPQSANTNALFATALQAKVTDTGGNPVSGVTVTFTAPGSGASGTFASTGTNTATATTSVSGFATAPAFTANATAGGPYNVVASAGAATSANFQLTNVANTVQVTIGTTPAGRSFTIDSVAFTTPQTVTWTIGSTHTIATTSPQAGAAGVRYVFSNWSDAGAVSHTVTANAAVNSYTATFSTEYQLTTLVAPAGSGTVAPSTGAFFAAGAVVPVTATASSGNTFANWTGPVAAAASASTTVTMTGPLSITANFTPGNTSLAVAISSKAGPQNARVWTLRLTNNGPGAANGAMLNSFGLTQTFGAACTPIITSPVSFPAAMGNIAPAGNASLPVTIDFTGCAATARFRLVTTESANGGTVSGSFTLNNQFQ